MTEYYSYNDMYETMKMIERAAEEADHAKRRPRETKYDITAFYNFRNKKKKRKGSRMSSFSFRTKNTFIYGKNT